ncbi:hypothetical protein LTR91_006299 [Friedmanniomyces endolithicus]|uniref:RRM domain-containing protein n=1 Tax=Friedmanniomyces endolithicus TaxID=329885 RepID=A0AAN6KSC5_9PEZI|nr:hypothetical protein LTR57_002128 [Friedmanniomyces endolithicus]KAK0987636.1 hypothetical protein LTS01_009554 [Friedmanniomyces endolithicus]KAK0998649.1 hypothetical protein LTR91_006299 [Friedmanniomyces endolithicus]
MDADSHEHDGPVIASSNRYDDLAPYCGRIYAVEPLKWREVMPWDFPQAASKDDEEAFLRKYFTEREIYIQGGVPYGYKFLKQVWYCIAMWNAQVKVPNIAEQWMREMGNTAADPAMTGYIMAEEAELKTFFMKQEIDKYGERLLGVAVKHIQYLVSTARQDRTTDPATGSAAHVSGATRVGTESLASDAAIRTGAIDSADVDTDETVKQGTGYLRPATHPDVTMSARVEKVGLAMSDYSASSESTGSGYVGRPRAGSSVGLGSNGPLPPQSRKRGNSNVKPNNGHNVTGQRHEQQRNDAFCSPPYQQWPQFNMAIPTIGSDRIFSVPYPTHNQMWNHPAHSQNPFQQLNGPPPPGMWTSGVPQQATGPPGLLVDDRNLQQDTPGYRASQHQQPTPVYYSKSQLNDRTNDHFVDNNQFNNGMHIGDGNRVGKQHDNNAARSSKPRGYSNGGRGKGSQGNRNSFTGSRPQHDFYAGSTGARHPSADLGKTQGSGGGYSNRRTSAASTHWSQNQAQHRPKENAQPARAFSGPDGRNPLSSVYWAPASGNTGLPPRQSEHRPFEPGFCSPSDSHSSQRSTQQTPYNGYQYAASTTTPPLNELIHDDKDPKAALHSGKVVTEYHIGAECSHVRKLLVFAVPAFDGALQRLGEFFERCGPVRSVRSFDSSKTSYKGNRFRDFWITFGNHFAAMNALGMDGQQLSPGVLLKVRVPKEYWHPMHDRYPGQGHPESLPKPAYHRFSFEPSWSDNTSVEGSSAAPEHREHEQHASGGSTPVAKASTNATLHKELLSGSTTPTPSSGASSPRKKKQSKGKGKMRPSTPLDQVVASAAEETQKRTDSVRDASQAKDDAVADATVPADVFGNAKTFRAPESSDSSSTTMTTSGSINVDNKADLRGSVSTQSSEPAQTISEIAFPPDAELTARLPPSTKPAVADGEAKADVTQSFREPLVPAEKKARESGRVDVAVVAKAEKKADRTLQGGGESVAGQSTSTAANSVTESAQAISSKDTNTQSMRNTVYPAAGTLHQIQQGNAERKQDRESEESAATNDTGCTASTDRSRASTVIHRPETPIGNESLRASSTASIKSGQQATESVASPDAAAKPQDVDGASAIVNPPGVDHSPTATSPGSPPSTTAVSAAKSFSRRAPVALPRASIIEPRMSSGDSVVGLQVSKRTVSGNSIPPTPAFVTAPSTPALPAEPVKPEEIAKPEQTAKRDETAKPESDAGDIAEQLEPSLKVVKVEEKTEKVEKPEKSKGQARTPSLLGGLFTKPPKQKPKKAKAQKGKGSIRGKLTTDESVTSEAPSEDLLDRIMSGTMQLGEPANKRASTLETKANGAGKDASQQAIKKRRDSKVRKSADAPPNDPSEINSAACLEQNEEQPTTKPPSSDVSLVKSRGTLGCLLSYLGSPISFPALTLDTKAEEPSQQPNPTVEKSDDLTAKGTELRPTSEAPADAKFDRVFTGHSELSDAVGLAPVGAAGSDKTFLGWPEQPFRSFRKDGLTYGAFDGGDGGDGSAGEVGLGIMATLRSDLDAAAVSEEAKPKKKKKKSNKKRKSKVSEQVDDDVEDEGIVTGSPVLLGEDEKNPGNGEFKFRFTANSEPGPGINPLQDTKSESTSQNVISETSSEASSRTLGRSTSHDHTPSSTAAASSTHGSPSRLQNMIRKQNDGVIVPAPNRTLMLRRRNNARVPSGANKTAESEGSSPVGTNKSEKGKSVWVEEDPMSSSSDDGEAEGSGNSMDKILDQVQRHSMKQSRPLLYLYVGGGRQEKKDEEGKAKARVEELKEDGEGVPDVDEEKLDKVAKRRFLTVGLPKA